MSQTFRTEVLIVGGGLAGLVTALECLRAGKTVCLVDRDTPQRLGGLALWAFGGMALVGTPLQARLRIPDTPEVALRDWIRFGGLGEDEILPRRWAEFYVQHSRVQVHDWLQHEGVRFLPAVNWVERGLSGEGNSLPRYHIVWGTARELVRRMLAALDGAGKPGALRILSRHRVLSLEQSAGRLAGALALDEATGMHRRLEADAIVLAMGGINGSAEAVRANWPAGRPMPAAMLNGAHPFSDGRLHRWVEAQLHARITHASEMWNYAAGIPHPQPHFPGHGLSLIPCKSALWLDHAGRRIGPEPLVTGFDTHDLCRRVTDLDKAYTWHLLNWRIAAREFAISGAEHNQRIRDRQFLGFVLETVFGNRRLLHQMQRESPHFLVDDTLGGLVAKMNALAGTDDICPDVLEATVDDFDANFRGGGRLQNDDQIRRILHARRWPSDRLRTCRPAPFRRLGAGPYIAIQTQFITRKSLGGLQTDLESRVLDANGDAIPGLYAVGEAAGFGGGGACGKRSLEGTFLPGCILTARAAARSLATGHGL
jgi:predicted oxidoreductase